MSCEAVWFWRIHEQNAFDQTRETRTSFGGGSVRLFDSLMFVNLGDPVVFVMPGSHYKMSSTAAGQDI